MRKKIIQVHICVFGPKLLRWNFLQISQLSIWSGVHKLLRRFLDFSQCSTAISQKYWRHLATKMRTHYCTWKDKHFRKKRWKQTQNRHINCDVVSEMTYTVSSGTLNSSIPYHTINCDTILVQKCPPRTSAQDSKRHRAN